jgi:hypothetical protein
MQLILRRAVTSRAVTSRADSVVIAASPDSLARQPWQWDVRIESTPVGLSLEYDCAAVGPHHVCVRVDESLVAADLATLEVREPLALIRPAEVLWLAVVEHGGVRQGHYACSAGDVLVWEGADPTEIDLSPTSGRATLALVELRRLDGLALRWVP